MKSLPDLVRQAVVEFAERPAVQVKHGNDLEAISYRQWGAEIETAARGLLAEGLVAGEHVVLLSENCPAWVTADCAILCCGAVTVPIYPSLPAEQVAPLIARVRARIVIVEDAAQLAKLDATRGDLPTVERVFVLRPEKVPEDHPLARPWDSLLAAGQDESGALAAVLDERIEALEPSSLATIIFTSGTTGIPKGAMLTHGNLLTNVRQSQKRISLVPGERFVTFLPLAHVFMRMITFLGIHAGCSTLYNESLRSLLPNLRLVRPTVLIVVPRFLELMRDRTLDSIRARTGLAGKVALWALGVGDRWSRCQLAGEQPGLWLRLQHGFAERKVFSTIREQLGLDQMKFAVSGGAALPYEVARWFVGLGLTIGQGYGLTETSPVVTVIDLNGPARIDTIGPPIDGVEVKLADDGELLCRGENVMQGYFEMPEETAEAIDAEGWFHTGDIATWTPDGHLRITDRKKNIMVLASGKNVAPTPIESRLVASPLINQILLIGDNQNVVTALVVPAFEQLKTELEARGEPAADPASMVASKAAEKLVRAEIARLSDGLAPFEMVRKFRLLPQEFTIDRGEMTPSLKLRRREILDHYAELVREMAE